ncbi:ferric reductase like transmembrane component-domain-containing protein [Clohesyomyces aquaticus]|uniref:Ferric reductase like transmembrane component-domain-containing protein n=1 Tax=Clohesyomyces aquaticus TaxID=1231657 RepID=A0A1Y1YY17_9PLEO|nr:ferric reductase like transmembrane component-domain-containing protein [Clohesyomyces aquaticus]
MAKSWLQYQPAPIPIVNKSLPTNGLSVLVVFFIGLNVFYNLYRMPLEAQYLFVFADRCGIIFVANLPLLYLLAAKNQPIKFLTGYSYESLNIFHRRLGELVCLEALLHLLGMFGVWYGLLRHLGFSLARFIFNRVVLLGLGAFVAYEVLYFTSLGSFRQRCYEIFLALHIFLQFASLALLWFHHSQSRPYVGISMGILLVDRVIFRLWLKSSSHPATLTILDDDETMLLSADWDTTTTSSTLLPQSMTHGWKPNDHIFLTVPTLSRKHSLQAHPFTIFSAAPGPPRPSDSESNTANHHAWFSLLIRPQSGFTRNLLVHARLTPKIRIRVDGPYGSSHALDLLSSHSTAVIIAGGSGIAVAYPLLWALLCPRPRTSSLDIEPARPPTRKQRNVKLLWITHSLDHRSWVPGEKMRELEDWGLEVKIPPPTSVAGPGVGALLEEWVAGGMGDAGVVVSGPDGLVRDVRNVVAGLVGRGERVSVQVEKFGW